MDYLNIRSVTDSKKFFTDYSIFHPDSYITNKRKSHSTYNDLYQQKSNKLIDFQHSPTEYNLNTIHTTTTTTTTTNNNNSNTISSYPVSSCTHNTIHTDHHHPAPHPHHFRSYSTTPLSIKIHPSDKKPSVHSYEINNNSTSDICSTSSSLSDHNTTNGIHCSLSLNDNGVKREIGASMKHRTLPLVPPHQREHQHQPPQHHHGSHETLTTSQLTTPTVTWRIKDAKELYYDKKLLRLIEQLPKEKQNSIGLILLAMDVKFFLLIHSNLMNKSENRYATSYTTHFNNYHDMDIFSGGLEYRLREALQLVQPKNKILNNESMTDQQCVVNTSNSSNSGGDLNKTYLNKIIDVRSRKHVNDSNKASMNFTKESFNKEEDGRESGIDPDTLDETSTSMIGNSLSLNDMKYAATNGFNSTTSANTTEITKPNVITILRRLARYLALRIANKRHSLATANQHVARNAIEEKLLRSRLSELQTSTDYNNTMMEHLYSRTSWNSLNSLEINRGTLVNRFDRLHNNTIAVIQLLCQLARRLAILDSQLYYLNKEKFYENVILLNRNPTINRDQHDFSSSYNDDDGVRPATGTSETSAISFLTDRTLFPPNRLVHHSNYYVNSNRNNNSNYELSQIVEQQKQLVIQIKEAQLLRAELETCRRRLLESIPGNLKCDSTHTMIGKLGRDFNDDTPTNTSTPTMNGNNNNNNHCTTDFKLPPHTDKQMEQQLLNNNDPLKKSSNKINNNYELNDKQFIDCQQTVKTTSQFLRQRVTEHLIEFLNWFVLSQVS
ncbi:unnamed protein product [Schistosoma turkestanicum]|nr:unnamed protein product [Schistosoma turkestanicum]CAH8493580.1 unnamed protein product [Schistosoma turkestanicum]